MDVSYHNMDYLLLIVTAILAIFGIIMVFDASVVFASQTVGDKFYFLKQGVLGLFVGGIVSAFLANYDYHKLKRFVVPMMIISVILLIAVFIPGLGVELNGSHRWINLGFTLIQPTEITKFSFAIYLAAWLARNRAARSTKNLRVAFQEHFRTELIPFLVVLGGLCTLIIIEPDLGTTLIVGATSFAIYFISGTDSIHTLGSAMIATVMAGLGVFAAILSPYRLKRVMTFLPLLLRGEVEDPLGAGYQIQQILIAVGSGGIWGLGFGESRQKFQYLVEVTAVTDSIFAVIAEELGLVGCVIVLAIFALFVYRGFKIAQGASDKFGMLLASGITFWIGLQALLNIAANVAIIPLTGIPLPFLSYGNSAMIVNLAAVGVLLNISKQTKSA